ncbi:hypothetical protein V8F20_008865 [Naviculisporaceae sp. PSN 640]
MFLVECSFLFILLLFFPPSFLPFIRIYLNHITPIRVVLICLSSSSKSVVSWAPWHTAFLPISQTSSRLEDHRSVQLLRRRRVMW